MNSATFDPLLSGPSASEVAHALRQVGLDARSVDHTRPADMARSVLDAIERTGDTGRVVRAPVADLHFLGHGSILLMRDHSLWRLMSAGRLRAEVQRGDGVVERMPLTQLAHVYTGSAVEVVRPKGEAGVVAAVAGGFVAETNAWLQLGLVAAGATLLALLPPLATSLLLDRAFPEGARGILTAAVVATTLAAIYSGWLRLVRRTVIRGIDARLHVRLLGTVFERMLYSPFAELQDRTVGDASSMLVSAENVAKTLADAVVAPMFDALFACLFVAVLAVRMPLLAIGLLGVTFAVLAATVVLGRKLAQLQTDELTARSTQQSTLYEIISGAGTLKAAGVESRYVARWLGQLVDHHTLRIRGEVVTLGLTLLWEGLAGAAFVGVLVIGGALAVEGSLSVGTLLGATQLTIAFVGSAGRLQEGIVDVWPLWAHLKKLQKILAAAPKPLEPEALPLSEPLVAVDDVWFRYSADSPWIVTGVSLHLRRGDVQVLPGASGTGKTTLLRLIAGLYPPERGTVRILGREPSHAKAAIVYLPQQATLLGGSILDNLQLLSGGARPSRIFAAAEETGLAAIVAAMPMGYGTRLQPGGGTLSAGQRQLVALTGAVASDRPVVLLDEAFAHMDRLTQTRLMAANLFRDRAVILVSHDPLTWGERAPS